ncbi:MAG: HIT family protein [Patescibacteria group bacterium]|nr:HIT family protein [Patescibacteria group bacterium]
MNDCLFCKIIEGEIPSHKIYEDDKVFAFLDISPVSKGHTLIIPKSHSENLTQGTEESAADLFKTVHHLAPKIMTALEATAYNIGMNHGADAGQLVFHTHVHFMPRYAGIPRTFEKQHPSQEELAAVAEEIRQGME